MGFDETKVNRNSAGSSEGGQFASKDEARASAGQVSDAFEDFQREFNREEQVAKLVEQVPPYWSSYYNDYDETSMGRFYTKQAEELLATGSDTELYEGWSEATADARWLNEKEAIDEAARALGMEPDELDEDVVQEVRQYLWDNDTSTAYEQRLKASNAVLATEDEYIGERDPEQALFDAAVRHGADPNNAELRRSIRAVVSNNRSELDDSSSMHMEFNANLYELSSSLQPEEEGVDAEARPRRISGAVLRINEELEVPLGTVTTTLRPGTLTSREACWKDDHVTGNDEPMTDEHNFPLGTTPTSDTTDEDGTRRVVLRDERHNSELAHVVGPDGSQEWTRKAPRLSELTRTTPDGSRWNEVRTSSYLLREHTAPDGSYTSYIEDGTTVNTEKSDSSGNFERVTNARYGERRQVRESGNDNRFTREVSDSADETIARTELRTGNDGRITGSVSSRGTTVPVEVERHGWTATVRATVPGRAPVSFSMDVPEFHTNSQLAQGAADALESRLAPML